MCVRVHACAHVSDAQRPGSGHLAQSQTELILPFKVSHLYSSPHGPLSSAWMEWGVAARKVDRDGSQAP
jgi:hypothetical protein